MHGVIFFIHPLTHMHSGNEKNDRRILQHHARAAASKGSLANMAAAPKPCPATVLQHTGRLLEYVTA
jgi:hypothetical protein